MGNRPTYPCVCAACGWVSRRGVKNIYKPCLKCGGAMRIKNQEDQTALQISGVIAIIICAGFAFLLAALKQ